MLAKTRCGCRPIDQVLTGFGDQTLARGWLAAQGMPAMS